MTRNALLSIVIMLILAILAVIGHRLSPRLHTSADQTLPMSACNPGLQTCTAALPGGGQLALSIEPRPIRPLQPFNVSAEITVFKADKVEIDFAGSNMEMGYNRPELAGRSGRFIGQAVLPVCITGSMEWTATVLITAENQRVAIPFQFATAAR
jgi:hypothetical protein